MYVNERSIGLDVLNIPKKRALLQQSLYDFLSRYLV
jgi:hypothetical protein